MTNNDVRIPLINSDEVIIPSMTNNDDRIPLTNSKTEVHNHSANKYSKRIRTKNKQFKDYISELEYASAANISVKKALTSDRAKESRDAILDEIKTMIDYNVGYFQKFEDIPHDSKSQILRTFMFLKNKETPDGRFERVRQDWLLMAHNKTKHSTILSLLQQ